MGGGAWLDIFKFLLENAYIRKTGMSQLHHASIGHITPLGY